MLIINKVRTGGFTNIEEVSISLNNITALIAPNNYGKSNVLTSIEFGLGFISAPEKMKISLMRFRPFIPINKNLEEVPFFLEIEGTLDWGGDKYNCVYGYSFVWAKTQEEDKGARIVKEYLKMKNESENKYKTYINRNEDGTCYLASPTGRCSKELPLSNNQLAINKLENYDDLYYIAAIREFKLIEPACVNTLENPDQYFTVIAPDDDVNEFNLAFPKTGKIGFFINSLKELDFERYTLLKNTLIDLLPNVEDFEPIQIDLKEDNKTNEPPFRLPETFYDIRVKEVCNNQPTSISRISSGCKKVLYVLSLTIAAEYNKMPIITFEELENSVHPKLLQNLLTALSGLAGNTKIIITSHSPYLIKYLNPGQIEFGLPNRKGLAQFKALKTTKINKVMRQASDEEASLGEYLFDMILNAAEEDELLNEYFI